MTISSAPVLLILFSGDWTTLEAIVLGAGVSSSKHHRLITLELVSALDGYLCMAKKGSLVLDKHCRESMSRAHEWLETHMVSQE